MRSSFLLFILCLFGCQQAPTKTTNQSSLADEQAITEKDYVQTFLEQTGVDLQALTINDDMTDDTMIIENIGLRSLNIEQTIPLLEIYHKRFNSFPFFQKYLIFLKWKLDFLLCTDSIQITSSLKESFTIFESLGPDSIALRLYYFNPVVYPIETISNSTFYRCLK